MPQLALTVPVGTFSLVLIVLALKHYLADFLLQTNWVARGKEQQRGWALPLALHVLCHAVLMLLIALLIAPRLWWLALIDVIIHAAIDRCKTLVAHRGRWTAAEAPFWWLIGFDQCLHQVTNVVLTAALFVL